MLNEGKKQKLHKELSMAYDLGRNQSDSTFAVSPVNVEGPNIVSTVSTNTNKKRKKDAIQKLVQKHMKTFEEFMLVARNYDIL